MSFPVDVPIWLIYIVVAAFWAAVLFQWLQKQKRIADIRAAEKCPNCAGQNLVVDVHTVNRKSGKRVGLLKNVWGASMLFTAAAFLLWGGVQLVTDLLTGSDATGIQGDDWKVVVGMLGLTVVGGLGCAVVGVVLLLAYLTGGKEAVVDMKCADCGTTGWPV